MHSCDLMMCAGPWRPRCNLQYNWKQDFYLWFSNAGTAELAVKHVDSNMIFDFVVAETRISFYCGKGSSLKMLYISYWCAKWNYLCLNLLDAEKYVFNLESSCLRQFFNRWMQTLILFFQRYIKTAFWFFPPLLSGFIFQENWSFLFNLNYVLMRVGCLCWQWTVYFHKCGDFFFEVKHKLLAVWVTARTSFMLWLSKQKILNAVTLITFELSLKKAQQSTHFGHTMNMQRHSKSLWSCDPLVCIWAIRSFQLCFHPPSLLDIIEPGAELQGGSYPLNKKLYPPLDPQFLSQY